MDISALKEGLSLIASAIGLLKQAKDLLPDSPTKTEAAETLEHAERQLKLAEVQTMQSLGYELCRNHPIPEIMLSKDDANWDCPKCENHKYTGTVVCKSPYSSD